MIPLNESPARYCPLCESRLIRCSRVPPPPHWGLNQNPLLLSPVPCRLSHSITVRRLLVKVCVHAQDAVGKRDLPQDLQRQQQLSKKAFASLWPQMRYLRFLPYSINIPYSRNMHINNWCVCEATVPGPGSTLASTGDCWFSSQHCWWAG